MKESKFQSTLIKELKSEFPGAIVVKGNSTYKQGIPDLIVLYNDRWAALEVKDSATARKRPNQDYYVDVMGEMSYAAFIYPENKEEVFSELQRTFRS